MRIPTYSVRLVREKQVAYPKAGNAPQAAKVLHALLDDAPAERFVVLYVDGQANVVGAEVVAMGGLHGCSIGPREVFRGAILSGASAIILGHNHPSGDPTPSDEDGESTSKLRLAARHVGIDILDHIIVCANGKHASMFERGWV